MVQVDVTRVHTSTSLGGRRMWPVPEEVRQYARPIAWLTCGLLVAYVYAGLFTRLFAVTLPHPLFVPQAVILATLLLTPRRTWWVYLVFYYALQLCQGVWEGLAFPYIAMSNVANVIEPLIGAVLIRHFVPPRQKFASLRNVSIYVASVMVASAVGATWGATTRLERGFPFWPSWQGWFLGDVIASLVLAPMIVLWATHDFRRTRSLPRARILELLLLGGALVIVGRFIFASEPDPPEVAPALLYLPVPLLVWAAVRFGPEGILTTLSIVTLMAIGGAANNLGPFEGRSSASNVLTMQLFLLGVGIPLFMLSALMNERQKAQARLAESEERYRVMVRSLPNDAVLVFGRDLRHQFADGQGLAGIGVSKESVEGQTLVQAFPPDLASALEPHYRSALAGTHSSFEQAHAGRQFKIYALPIPDTTEPTGMAVVHDVTDQKRAELLAELDRTKTAFFSNVSHELRTPLTLVLGPLHDALESGSLSGDALRLVHRNAFRLQRLVNDLLDLTRIEAGRMEASFEQVDLPALTAELASNFRSAIERAGLRFVVTTPPLPLDVQVYVDRDMYEKVVFNLLSNALNHTFDGEIGVELDIPSDRQQVVLRVSDTGVGIPPHEQARIFERFHQVPGARSRGQVGTGIGLALVRELARLHGGAVKVHSVVGRGTTFEVSLPVGSAHIAPDRIKAPTVPNALLTETAPVLDDDEPDARDAALVTGATASNKRILVADDNADMRRYVVDILGRDWTVQTVADGLAALQALRQDPPDLVLLDVMMPELNGFEVLEALREDPSTRKLPVIIVSARAGEEAAVEGLASGANDYIAKPFASAELSARVRTQLEAAEARSQAEAALKARDDFVALVAHDLRHPLAAVNWHVQVLHRVVLRGETPPRDELLQLLDTIEMGVTSLSAQIAELREASQLHAGKRLDLHRETADLVDLVRSTLRQYDDSSGRHTFQFEPQEPSLYGKWDVGRLVRVVDNLLSNATKYSPAGSTITVRIARDGEWGVLSVADEGVGISAADLSHVFDRYWRGSNAASRVAGSGLGLSSARGIIQQHGGTISVSSREGEGSTFVIRLPLAPAR